MYSLPMGLTFLEGFAVDRSKIYAADSVQQPDVNKKTIVCFPGDGLHRPSTAMESFCTTVASFLKADEKENTAFFCAYYPASEYDLKSLRVQQLAYMGALGETPDAQEITALNPCMYYKAFDRFFSDYIYDETGAILPEEQIAKNLSNLLLIGNCHGTVVTSEFVLWLKDRGVSPKACHSLKIINYSNRGIVPAQMTARVLNINSQGDFFTPKDSIRSDHILSAIYNQSSDTFSQSANDYFYNVRRGAKSFLIKEDDNIITLAPISVHKTVIPDIDSSGPEHLISGLRYDSPVSFSRAGIDVKGVVCKLCSDFAKGVDTPHLEYINGLSPQVFYTLSKETCRKFNLPEQPASYRKASFFSEVSDKRNTCLQSYKRACYTLINNTDLVYDPIEQRILFANIFFSKENAKNAIANIQLWPALEKIEGYGLDSFFIKEQTDEDDNPYFQVGFIDDKACLQFLRHIHLKPYSTKQSYIFKTVDEANAFFEKIGLKESVAEESTMGGIRIHTTAPDDVCSTVCLNWEKGTYIFDNKEYQIPASFQMALLNYKTRCSANPFESGGNFIASIGALPLYIKHPQEWIEMKTFAERVGFELRSSELKDGLYTFSNNRNVLKMAVLSVGAKKNCGAYLEQLKQKMAQQDELYAQEKTPLNEIYGVAQSQEQPLGLETQTTKLMVAVVLGNMEAVQDILRKNPETINRTNSHFETAAHLAYQEKRFDILQILSEAGADLSKTSFTGLCVLEELADNLPKNQKDKEIVRQILEKHPFTPEMKKQASWTREYYSTIKIENLSPMEMRENAKKTKVARLMKEIAQKEKGLPLHQKGLWSLFKFMKKSR